MLQLNARALQPNALFALRYVHDARLSPDGAHVAYVTSKTIEKSAEELFEITIENLDTGARREFEFSGCATFPRWAPDGTRIVFIGDTEGSSRLFLGDIETLEVTALTPEDSQVQGPPSWSPDGGNIVYSAVAHRKADGRPRVTKRVFQADRRGNIEDLTVSTHLVDVETRGTRSLNMGIDYVSQPAFSPDGKSILFLGSDAAAGYPPLTLKLFTFDLAEERLLEVLGGRWYIAAAAWGVCGDRIVIVGDYDSELTVPIPRLWVVDKDGANQQCRTTNAIGSLGVHAHHDMPTWGTSQNNFFLVPERTHAYATVTRGGCAEIWRVALEGPLRCDPVISGARTCVILDASADASRMLYGVSDLNTPWELCVSDTSGREERRVTRLNDSVTREWPPLTYQHLKYTSEDGLPLEGWYLARADRNGPQPTVLFIHGGPELVVGHAFRFDFHLLAANGYSVLFANFRGSSGYGQAFRAAIVGDRGALTFPDHMATVNEAVRRGLADPERLGVWGPSHGGFSTCWIVGHTTRFRAAVAEAAVTNLSTLYYLSDLPDLFARDAGGRPEEIPEVYRARSPLTYAAHCRTPTLMLHGAEDLRCRSVEAEQFYRALHDAGCKTELVQIPGMTHMGDSIGPLSARLGQNDALLDWFERYL